VERRASQLFAQPLAVWERDGLKAVLGKAGLATNDVGESRHFFWRFERDDVPAGFGGLEIHGKHALLRSLVTLPPLRMRGVGRAMVDKLETEARALGARTVYLLTTNMAAFFTQLGYAACDRTSVPPAIAATAQFAELCPASATAMMKQI